MQIHLSEVLSQPGETRCYTAALDWEHFNCNGVVYPVLAQEPVQLGITHKDKKKLTLVLKVRMTLSVPCDRCLADVEVPMAFESELKVDMGKTAQQRIDDLEETAFIEGYTLDVDKLVEGEMLVHMPMKVLCSEDCAGLEGGTASGPGTCDCDEVGLDPRMAVIRDLFQKANQEGDKEV